MTLEWPSALTRGWIKIDRAISHVDARCDCVAVAPAPSSCVGLLQTSVALDRRDA
jgi:hypothetical protein